MKTSTIVCILTLLAASMVPALGQTSPTERRSFREYTSPEELVSIAPTATMDKALAAISEVSRKFIGKVIVDTERRTMPVNVDIQGVQWRDALEMICRKSEIWYTEYENYIQLTSSGDAPTADGGARQFQAGTAGANPDIQKEFATFRSREVRISGVFLEANLSKLDEIGLNWSFMKSTADYSFDASLAAADKVSSEIFKVGITPKVSFANITVLAKMFSSYNLGQIISSPQINVRSGEEGRIQVGQDFSIKERDFAGNVIDKFYSAGAIIKVRPQVINEQGVNFVHMVVDVERSSVIPGSVSTIINKTKASTNVLLLDGEETIIGGLYNTEITTVRTGVPFLKDLPWYIFGLRYLFGYNKEEEVKKELIILLKAELVPTLQERITQKTTRVELKDQWRAARLKEEQDIKSESPTDESEEK